VHGASEDVERLPDLSYLVEPKRQRRTGTRRARNRPCTRPVDPVDQPAAGDHAGTATISQIGEFLPSSADRGETWLGRALQSQRWEAREYAVNQVEIVEGESRSCDPKLAGLASGGGDRSPSALYVGVLWREAGRGGNFGLHGSASPGVEGLSVFESPPGSQGPAAIRVQAGTRSARRRSV
jgi:hypothetical protein